MDNVILRSKDSIVVGDYIYKMDEAGNPNEDIEPIHIEMVACDEQYLKSLNQMELMAFAQYFHNYREIFFGGYPFNA